VTLAADVVGLVLPPRRCDDVDDALKSIAGGSEEDARPTPHGLASPARGDRPCSADLPSRGAGAGGDDRAAAVDLQVRWCVSQ